MIPVCAAVTWPADRSRARRSGRGLPGRSGPPAAILWTVVFVSGGLLIFLQVSDARSQAKVVWRTTLIAVIVVMTLEVTSLAALDRPFSPIAGIQPTAMTDAIGLLTAGRTDLPTSHACLSEAS